MSEPIEVPVVEPLARIEEQTFAADLVEVPKTAGQDQVVKAITGSVVAIYAQAAQTSSTIAPQTIQVHVGENEADTHATFFVVAKGWKAVVQ